jgi:hypothetical protein
MKVAPVWLLGRGAQMASALHCIEPESLKRPLVVGCSELNLTQSGTTEENEADSSDFAWKCADVLERHKLAPLISVAVVRAEAVHETA